MPCRESRPATLDERCDVAQLALIAVSLMAGRRIAHEDYPDTLREVLDEIARRHHAPGPVRFEIFVIGSNAHCRSTTGRSDSAQDAEIACGAAG